MLIFLKLLHPELYLALWDSLPSKWTELWWKIRTYVNGDDGDRLVTQEGWCEQDCRDRSVSGMFSGLWEEPFGWDWWFCTKLWDRTAWQLKVCHNLLSVCLDKEFRLHSVGNSKAQFFSRVIIYSNWYFRNITLVALFRRDWLRKL